MRYTVCIYFFSRGRRRSTWFHIDANTSEEAASRIQRRFQKPLIAGCIEGEAGGDELEAELDRLKSILDGTPSQISMFDD